MSGAYWGLDVTKEDDEFLKRLGIGQWPDSDAYRRRPPRARKWAEHCPECKMSAPMHDDDCPLQEDNMNKHDEFGDEFSHFDQNPEDDPFESADSNGGFAVRNFTDEAYKQEVEEKAVAAIKQYLKVKTLSDLMHLIMMLL